MNIDLERHICVQIIAQEQKLLWWLRCMHDEDIVRRYMNGQYRYLLHSNMRINNAFENKMMAIITDISRITDISSGEGR